ncbi:BCCT family transporter [Mariniluteicoccus flavus]
MASSATEPPATAAPRQPVVLKKSVIGTAAGLIAVVALWALISPTSASTALGAAVGFLATYVGWFYMLLAAVVLVFVIYLGIRFRKVRLGPADSRPEFNTFTWAAMLFAAGLGTDLLFFSVAEPVSHLLEPPAGTPGSPEAAAQAPVWTIFHYGITGWGMYALMGLALGFFAHRRGMPLAVRSALRPVLGNRVDGFLGDLVDAAAVVGGVFGIATSLGIGVVQLNVGLQLLFGIEQGIPAQLGLIALAVITSTISAISGVARGVKLMSQLNVGLALVLAAWVLFTGNTAHLAAAVAKDAGEFVALFPSMTWNTLVGTYPAEWVQAWTLFFWAWWIAWAAFVGLFLARISRGRTIGSFVLGTLLIPFSYVLVWISLFGNRAIDEVRRNPAFGEKTVAAPEQGFYSLLQASPGATVLIAIATLVGLLLYVTSADSGAIVMANLSAEAPEDRTDAPWWLRTIWSVGMGVLTIAMLLVGGITALQNATIVMALPFAIVMVLVMVGLGGALRKADQD